MTFKVIFALKQIIIIMYVSDTIDKTTDVADEETLNQNWSSVSTTRTARKEIDNLNREGLLTDLWNPKKKTPLTAASLRFISRHIKYKNKPEFWVELITY